ncbi:4440_t:CDS:2, partial [Scutellospora calospora]
MIPSLDFDVLSIIISQIQLEDPYDYKSLYNCILVNKKWCEAGIPIIWQNPFTFNEICLKYPISSGKIIEILLSCFNKAQITELYNNIQTEFPIFFESETSSNLFKFLQNFNKPTFNYPLYIKSLSYRGLFISSIMWFKLSPYNIHFEDQPSNQIFLKLIIRSLLKLFISNQLKFKRVVIEGMNDNQFKFKRGIIEGMNDEAYWWEYYVCSKMLFEQEFKSLFKNIRKLDIEGIDEDQVEDMVNGWKDFSTLKTLKVQINKHFSTILSNTPFLRKIYINRGDINFLLPLLASPIPSRTLTSITLHNVKFDKSDRWELLSSLHNLEKLKLIVCWIHPDVDFDARQDMILKVTNELGLEIETYTLWAMGYDGQN